MAKKNNQSVANYPIGLQYNQAIRLQNLAGMGIDVTAPRTVQIISITPSMASIMISHNIQNRHLNSATVQKYKRTMLKGNWNFEGYISFTDTGVLSNGQQRLNAIIESGMTYDFVVVFGMDIHADTDTGRTRTAFDNFCIMNNLPAKITNKKCVGLIGAMCRRKNKSRRGASNDEIQDAIFHWKKELEDMADIINTQRGTVWFNVALFSAYLNGVDITEIEAFKTSFINISNVSPNRVSFKELPVKALADQLSCLTGSGTDQNMNFVLTATQNALYEYINNTGCNMCLSSKAPIWEYSCSFLNDSKLANFQVTDSFY